jgi:hypothetical protein
MNNPIRTHKVGYLHRGSIYFGIIGFTNRHLSLAERATIRERGRSGVPPSPSSTGRDVYSVDDAMKGPTSSLSPCLEVKDGCGRRKKYARGMANGKTYVIVGVRKAQR